MKSMVYLVAVLLLVACDDEKDITPAPPDECEVASIAWVPTVGDPVTAAFIYGNDGKLTHLTSDGATWIYQYHANGFSRKTNSSQNWSTVSHVELNAKGLPEARYDTTFQGGNAHSTTSYTYEYNAQDELINVFKNNDPQPTLTCTWIDGNVVKLEDGSVSYLLDYYDDKPNEDYTFMDLKLLFSMGINPCRSKNLLRALSSGGEQMIFKYEFEEQKMNEWYATILGNPDTVLVGKQQFICE